MSTVPSLFTGHMSCISLSHVRSPRSRILSLPKIISIPGLLPAKSGSHSKRTSIFGLVSRARRRQLTRRILGTSSWQRLRNQLAICADNGSVDPGNRQLVARFGDDVFVSPGCKELLVSVVS